MNSHYKARVDHLRASIALAQEDYNRLLKKCDHLDPEGKSAIKETRIKHSLIRTCQMCGTYAQEPRIRKSKSK